MQDQKELSIGKKLMEILKKEISIILIGSNLLNLKRQEIMFKEFWKT